MSYSSANESLVLLGCKGVNQDLLRLSLYLLGVNLLRYHMNLPHLSVVRKVSGVIISVDVGIQPEDNFIVPLDFLSSLVGFFWRKIHHIID